MCVEKDCQNLQLYNFFTLHVMYIDFYILSLFSHIRLVTYHDSTKPIIEYYKELNLVERINAGRTIDEVMSINDTRLF